MRRQSIVFVLEPGDLSKAYEGWQFRLFVLDEITRHDASAIVDMVALTLEDCYQTATHTNKSMPTSLLIMSDNTVREAKNQYLLGYLNNLVAKYKMKMVGLLNLRKSHTHDRLDQCWGILARRIAASDRLLSAQTVIDILEEELARPGMRAFIGLETMVKVSKLDAVRAWKDFFNPTQQVGLRGGLLEDSSANHCFISMLRKGKFNILLIFLVVPLF